MVDCGGGGGNGVKIMRQFIDFQCRLPLRFIMQYKYKYWYPVAC